MDITLTNVGIAKQLWVLFCISPKSLLWRYLYVIWSKKLIYEFKLLKINSSLIISQVTYVRGGGEGLVSVALGVLPEDSETQKLAES